MYPGSWAVGIVGGYTVDCVNITYQNVSRPITVKIGFSGRVDTAGILMDLDGTLAGVPGGSVVPYTGQFADNPDCTIISDTMHEDKGELAYAACTKPVRRVSLAMTSAVSAFVNFERLYRFPHFHIFDVTEYSPEDDALENGATDSSTAVWGARGHYTSKRGPQSCVPQAPSSEYMFLASVGREYLVLLRDQMGIPVTADVKLSAFKMKPDEQLVFRFCHKPPMQDGSLWADVKQLAVESWGENNMDIGWENPGPMPPDYTTGAVDDASCAFNELSQCATDDYLRSPELAGPVRIDPSFATVTAKAQGRTFRGGRLWPTTGSLASSWTYASDFLLALDGIPTDATGVGVYLRQFSETAVTFEDEDQPMDFNRWRYGYDWEGGAHPGGHGGWHTGPDPTTHESIYNPTEQEFENGTRTLTPAKYPQFCLDAEHINYKKVSRFHHGAFTRAVHPCDAALKTFINHLSRGQLVCAPRVHKLCFIVATGLASRIGCGQAQRKRLQRAAVVA